LSLYILVVIFFLSTSQEIVWEEHHRNDIFCAEWGVKLDPVSQLLLLLCGAVTVSVWSMCVLCICVWFSDSSGAARAVSARS